jgi:hypothetical protein
MSLLKSNFAKKKTYAINQRDCILGYKHLANYAIKVWNILQRQTHFKYWAEHQNVGSHPFGNNCFETKHSISCSHTEHTQNVF